MGPSKLTERTAVGKRIIVAFPINRYHVGSWINNDFGSVQPTLEDVAVCAPCDLWDEHVAACLERFHAFFTGRLDFGIRRIEHTGDASRRLGDLDGQCEEEERTEADYRRMWRMIGPVLEAAFFSLVVVFCSSTNSTGAARGRLTWRGRSFYSRD